MTFNFDREFQSIMQEHNSHSVLLLGHLNPDGDVAGSVIGLAHYIKVNYPQYKVMKDIIEYRTMVYYRRRYVEN